MFLEQMKSFIDWLQNAEEGIILYGILYNIKIQKLGFKNIAVIILKLEQCGFTIGMDFIFVDFIDV